MLYLIQKLPPLVSTKNQAQIKLTLNFQFFRSILPLVLKLPHIKIFRDTEGINQLTDRVPENVPRRRRIKA